MTRGGLTVLTGHPDVGKTWLALYMATALSRGWPLFGDDGGGAPVKTLLLMAEDALSFVVGPRLDVLGADCTLIDSVRATRAQSGEEGWFSLVSDLDLLDAKLAQGYGLLIVELNNYLGAGFNTDRDASVRSVLTPLGAVAEKRDVAVVCLIHPTKGDRSLSLYRIQGSVANVAVVRTALVVGKDQTNDGEDSPRRHVALLKNNLMPDEDKPVPLTFELTREKGFQWVGTSDATVSGLLNGSDADREEKTALAEAVDFLDQVLADGPMDSKQAKRLARDAGITDITLRRARGERGVIVKHLGFGSDKHSTWELPMVIKEAISAQGDHVITYDAKGSPMADEGSKDDVSAETGGASDERQFCQACGTKVAVGATRCWHCGHSWTDVDGWLCPKHNVAADETGACPACRLKAELEVVS